MTAFSFEVPHAHLEDFDDLQDFYFCLSLHCKSERYLNFYRERSIKGCKQVWLDNSYNETGKADQIDELADIFYEMKAHKVVVPDNPAWGILEMTDSFYKAGSYFSSDKLICVVNSEAMRISLAARDATIFAVSYHVRLPYYQAMGPNYNQFIWAKEHHFLGLISIDEVRFLNPPTCDTSMPIKIAIMGLSLPQWTAAGSPHIHTKDILKDFFDAKLSKREISLARDNIKLLKEMCSE